MSLETLNDEHFDELGRPKKIKRDMSDWTVLKRIIKFIGVGPDRTKLWVLLMISVVNAGINFLNPYIIQQIVNQGLGGGLTGAQKNIPLIYQYAGYLGILLCISLFFWFSQAYLIQRLANRSMYQLRAALFDNLQNLSFDYYNQKGKSTGKIISYLTNDVETIQELIGQGLLNVIGNVFSIVGSLVLMFIVSAELTLVSFCIIPFIVLIAVFVFKNARRYFILMRRKVAAVSGHLNESINGMRIIKAFAVEDEDYHKFDKLTDAELAINIKAQKLFSAISPVIMIVVGLGIGIVVLTSAYLAVEKGLQIGNILAFILYLIGFMGPLMNVMQFFGMIQNSMAAGERIIKVIDTPSSIQNKPNAIQLEKLKGQVDFDHVSFEYEKNLPVVKDLDLHIKPKERIAIIGYTGAGKTTIISMLCRFYDVIKGAIRVDNHDIRDVTIHSLRSQIGLVLQDNLLFSGSVKENIRYGRQDASDADVISAAMKVGAHEFIMDLPKGYDTEVREHGNLLSVGQKQLIAFARALLINPPILILDEATSAVDPYSELIIQQALETLLKNRTSISIAHRLSTIVNSDRIIVLDQGRVIEEGNHKSLMDKPDSMYRHLFLMQFKDPFKK